MPQLAPMVATAVLVHGVEFGSDPGVHFAVAPVGRTVVFAGNYGGRTVLYRRDFDRVDPEPIVGTEGGSDVFFLMTVDGSGLRWAARYGGCQSTRHSPR